MGARENWGPCGPWLSSGLTGRPEAYCGVLREGPVYKLLLFVPGDSSLNPLIAADGKDLFELASGTHGAASNGHNLVTDLFFAGAPFVGFDNGVREVWQDFFGKIGVNAAVVLELDESYKVLLVHCVFDTDIVEDGRVGVPFFNGVGDEVVVTVHDLIDHCVSPFLFTVVCGIIKLKEGDRMSEKPEKKFEGVYIEEDIFNQEDEPLRWDEEGVPTFLSKPKKKRSEFDSLVRDGLVEDENGEWND